MFWNDSDANNYLVPKTGSWKQKSRKPMITAELVKIVGGRGLILELIQIIDTIRFKTCCNKLSRFLLHIISCDAILNYVLEIEIISTIVSK